MNKFDLRKLIINKMKELKLQKCLYCAPPSIIDEYEQDVYLLLNLLEEYFDAK